MLRTKSICVLAVMAFALSLHSQANNAKEQPNFAAMTKTMRVLGTWQGTTPCADCSGIVTTLTLYQKSANNFIGAVYRLHLKYIDRGSFTNYGSWTVLRGMPGNADATVYQLDPEKSGKQYYLRVDGDTLQQLDGDMKPIDSKLNFTLKRIAQTSLPPSTEK